MEFLHYINLKLSFLFFVMFIVALFLNMQDKEKQSFGFSIFVGSLFLASLFVLPLYTLNKVTQNKTLFENGNILKCVSGGGLGNSTSFIVHKDKWSIQNDYCINNENKIAIKIEHCDRF